MSPPAGWKTLFLPLFCMITFYSPIGTYGQIANPSFEAGAPGAPGAPWMYFGGVTQVAGPHAVPHLMHYAQLGTPNPGIPKPTGGGITLRGSKLWQHFNCDSISQMPPLQCWVAFDYMYNVPAAPAAPAPRVVSSLATVQMGNVLGIRRTWVFPTTPAGGFVRRQINIPGCVWTGILFSLTELEVGLAAFSSEFNLDNLVCKCDTDSFSNVPVLPPTPTDSNCTASLIDAQFGTSFDSLNYAICDSLDAQLVELTSMLTPNPVPTLSEWGLILFGLLLLCLGAIILWKRQRKLAQDT